MNILIPPELPILNDLTPALARIKGIVSSKPKEELIHPSSKTLILAIVFQSGVLMLSDKRVVDWGYRLVSDKVIKIRAVSQFSILGASGEAALCNFYLDWLNKTSARFVTQYGIELSPSGQAKYLQNLIEILTPEIGFFNYAVPLLAAYDLRQEKGKIFLIEPASSLAAYSDEYERFAGIGCGFPEIRGFLEIEFQKKYPLTLNSALEIAITGYALAGKQSIGVTSINEGLPSIAIATNKGVRFIRKKIMLPYVEKIKGILYGNKKGNSDSEENI